ncbi:MAG: undecaprenyl-diphosphatase UppP [Candidatus Kerfeldbacteria bacterium RIFCSPHIGHO2_12_FULL_48_17]|uniref:Undecaprenyl-diphosphatase n=1 Tax=Candidatus Kerfeldbacteria bacterium RIFCSPHIGHO2_12_FULL_48_17 TaxID=1798542 RepID=A0A1G2B3J0_9BACT|nr:MAG: undecaprenyl-diphosphatase UppP [Candidatus Kerfeldbacteria bacterium RIFCSPHIGHO2_12_FULL_48_17]
MSEIFSSVVLGIVQGATEFIPISSSGHLLLFHNVFGFRVEQDLFFDVALHVGTLLALLVYFRSDVYNLLRAWFTTLFTPRRFQDPQSRLAWFILLGTIPAALVGYFFEDIIDLYFRSSWVVVLMLILIGICFLLFDRDAKKMIALDVLTPKSAFFIGVAQALALIPGTSRSGITIIAARVAGLDRKAAARFSFLLSLPIVAGAGLKKAFDSDILSLQSGQFLALVVGVCVSAAVGLLAIRFLMKFLEKYSLRVFAYYRLALAAFIIIILLV